MIACLNPIRSIYTAELDTKMGSDFFVLTIPKCGTHLILKLLYMLTGKTHSHPYDEFPQLNALNFYGDNSNAYISNDQLEAAFTRWKLNNQFPIAHFNFSESFFQFSLSHPEYVKLIQIRDLRDACISFVFAQSQLIEQEIHSSNFDDKLMYMITLDDKQAKSYFIRLKKYAQNALTWIYDPTAVICRFENLVGKQGGGSQEAQKKEIIEIAKRLNIELTQDKLEEIIDHLFGNSEGPEVSATFRSGQIGSWRKYFKKEHIKAFKEHLGDFQIQLGYSIDD
jgi:hypothetical protein